MSALWQSCCAVLPTAEELSKNEETFGCAESPKTGPQTVRKGARSTVETEERADWCGHGVRRQTAYIAIHTKETS